MKKIKPLELDEIELEEIATQVKEGYTSGKLDNGEGKHIYWELKKNIWYDNQKEALTQIGEK